MGIKDANRNGVQQDRSRVHSSQRRPKNRNTHNESIGGNASTRSEHHSQAAIKCKVFEDNSGALTLATLPKIRP